MLDIKFIAENTEYVKRRLALRNKAYDVDLVVSLYNQRRELLKEAEQMKATRNSVSDKIAVLKREKKDCESLIKEMKDLGESIKALDIKLQELEPGLKEAALNIANLPDESVPEGFDEKNNKEIRRYGKVPQFDFAPKPHWELGEKLGILDAATAAKITGARFTVYKGDGAKLERALMNLMLDTHAKHGYKEIFPPFMVNADSMTGTGQLPKFKEDAFAVLNTNYYLVPTAEVPVTNMHRGEVLEAKQLPINYCAYTSCFRAEAGSAGRDTRGLIRQHQFQKVELVKFCLPENSFNELENITADAERILQLLGLSYRVVCLCAGDLGFASAKTYDIEVWLPSYNKYVEISSCSNYCDFQARRMNIKYSDGKNSTLLHTLNGSGIPLGRTAAAIIENFQNADGSVNIPDALVPYFGSDIITNNK